MTRLLHRLGSACARHPWRVTAAWLAAIGLLPAVLAALGPRVFGRRARQRAAQSGTLPADSFHSPGAERLARRVTRRPVLWVVISAIALLALAAPAVTMRLGQNDPGSESADKPTRQAFDLVAEGFGPGANGPLVAVVDRDQLDAARLDTLRTQIMVTPGVSALSPVTESADGRTAVFQIVPATADSTATRPTNLRRSAEFVFATRPARSSEMLCSCGNVRTKRR